MPQIPINIAFEDALSGAALRRLLSHCSPDYVIGASYTQNGSGYLKRMTVAFNNSARGMPLLMLTDLDDKRCPSELLQEWLTATRHHNFLFRVAVHEVEAWLIGDARGLAEFLGIRAELIPQEPEGIQNPKEELIRLAKKSPRRDLRNDLVPKQGSTAKVGPNYNARLSRFVSHQWHVEEAAKSCPSLARLIERLSHFQPEWSEEE